MSCSLHDTKLQAARKLPETGPWWLGFPVPHASWIQNAIPTFPISKLILSQGSYSLLIMRDFQAGRMTSWEKSREVLLTCAYKVGWDKASRNIPQEQICNWERKKQPKWSFQTHMSVIKFLLGERGREIRADLGKGWSHSLFLSSL